MRLPQTFAFLRKPVVALAVAGLGFCTVAHAQTNRITQPISSASGRVALANTVLPRALAGKDLGAAPADRTLSSVTLRFNMSDAQTNSLNALLAAQQNASSPLYHQWLTPEQFGARFGLSSPDIAKVTAWLQGQGLTVTGVARGQSFVTVSGTVAKLQTAFGTSIHMVEVNGEQHIANLTEPTLPKAIAAVVGTVTGLSDIRLKPHARPHFTSSLSGDHFIAPGDFYTIYDINPLLTANVDGTGVTIAVAGQTDIALTDIAAFRSASGLTANPPTVKLIGTDPGVPSTDDQVEASLDVEWSGAVAPGASILYVNSTDVIGGSLTQIIDQNLAPIATVSYGNCESGFGSSNIATFNQLFRQAAAQGQTIAGPAGDSGAADCDYQTSIATQGLAVDFPASSPYVTGVGGTMFNETSGVTYWNTTNGTDSGSAVSYIPEAVWNETNLGEGIAAGGGGASAYFVKPAWQIGTGVPSDSSRDVPDISFNAAASHDGYLFCQGGFCTSGYRNAAGNLDVVGGTSVSTPAFAGILALLEEKLQAKVGQANPTIYALADSSYYTSVFHDVTTGTNEVPCTLGTPNCTTVVTPCDTLTNTGNGCIGYSAGAGYDEATGWGSLDVFNFVNDWSLVTPLSSGTNGTSVSATAVTASSTSITTGTSLTITAKVTSATSGVTATPTGNAQLTIDGVNTGSIVALTNGTATFTYDTTSLSSGTHIFGVAYSGDTNYDGSKGTVSVDVTSATAADFTLSPSTASATTTSGGTAAGITFTVTPTSGFTGEVTFAASTTSSTLDATYAFNPTMVNITGTTAGSTVLTLVASESDAVGTHGFRRLGGLKAHSLTPGMPWQLPASGVALAGLLFFVLPKRRNRWTALALALVSAGLMGVSGCGGGNSDTATSGTTTTASGTYTITVTASGTNAAGTALSHSSTVTFVVQ